MRTILLVVILVVSLSGCGMFSKPALPRHGSIDSAHDPAADDFAARIRDAEIIYFPVEDLDHSVADLIRALRDEAKPFAIGWQDLGADEQGILDRLGGAQGGDLGVVDWVTWNVRSQSRASRQNVLRATSDLPQLALGIPKALRVKLQTGENLTAKERLLLPSGYRVPASDQEKFTEEHATRHDLRDGDIPKSYRLHLIGELFAAGKITDYMQQHPGGRMLIFLHRRDLERANGVPSFVTQKIKVRQLILEVGHGANGERPRLLTSRGSGILDSLL